jgi:hypothetical protein
MVVAKIVQVQVWGVFNTENELTTKYPSIKEQLNEFLNKYYEEEEDYEIAGYVTTEDPFTVKAVLIMEDGSDKTILSLIQFIPNYDPSKPATTSIDIEGRFMKKDNAIRLFGRPLQCIQEKIEEEGYHVLGYLVDFETAFPTAKIYAVIAINLDTSESTLFRVIEIPPPYEKIKEACNL